MADTKSIKVKKGDTLSQIAKKQGMSLQALLTLNPSIKNANQIKIGQSIKLPKDMSKTFGMKAKSPYARMSKTMMNMLRVENKDKAKQRTVTKALKKEVKDSGAQTSPTPKLAKSVKAKKDGVAQAVSRAKKQISKTPVPKSRPKAKKLTRRGTR